jgi:hypothetical protein
MFMDEATKTDSRIPPIRRGTLMSWRKNNPPQTAHKIKNKATEIGFKYLLVFISFGF